MKNNESSQIVVAFKKLALCVWFDVRIAPDGQLAAFIEQEKPLVVAQSLQCLPQLAPLPLDCWLFFC